MECRDILNVITMTKASVFLNYVHCSIILNLNMEYLNECHLLHILLIFLLQITLISVNVCGHIKISLLDAWNSTTNFLIHNEL